MKKIIVNKKGHKIFWWSLFYMCNKRCPDCAQLQLPSIETPPFKNLIKTAYKVRDYVNFYNYDKIYIMGGELSVLDKNQLLFIVNILSQTNKKIKIFSNFTADNDYYKTLFINTNIQFEFSFHWNIFNIEDYCKKLFSFVEDIKDYNAVKINFPLTKENKKHVFKLKELINGKIFIRFHPNLGLNKDFTCSLRGFEKDKTEMLYNSTTFPVTIINDDDSEEQLNMNDLRLSGETNFYNWLCTKHDSVWLYVNELKCYCSQHLITNDFINSDVKNIPCKKNHLCLSKTCQIVDSIISIEKIAKEV